MVAPAIIGALISGLASLTGGYLNRRKSTETGIQRGQRNTIDDLLASLQGGGKYSDLINFDEDAFNKSYVEPAKQRFKSQIVPQIQQSYIASGQQRGTGIEDTLTRAGVDLDQMLNQQYASMQQGSQNRKIDFIKSILGQSAGAAPEQSRGSALGESVGGYLSSESSKNLLDELLKLFQNQPQTPQITSEQRSGFES